MAVLDRGWGAEQREREADAGPVSRGPIALLSLQLLFPGLLKLDPQKLTRSLRAYHPQLSQAVFEMDAKLAAHGTPVGSARWGRHLIELVGFNAPMPAFMVEKCVEPARYSEELKARARDHQSHVLLYYRGRERSPLEQYVALAAVAATLAAEGALVVLNESAHASMPAASLARGLVAGDKLELLRSLPAPVLYSGLVPMQRHGTPEVWVRTYGNHLLGVPELATLAAAKGQENSILEMFSNVIGYVLASGATLGAGHTMQVGTHTFIRLRYPRADEAFLAGDSQLLVAERITASQINSGYRA